MRFADTLIDSDTLQIQVINQTNNSGGNNLYKFIFQQLACALLQLG